MASIGSMPMNLKRRSSRDNSLTRPDKAGRDSMVVARAKISLISLSPCSDNVVERGGRTAAFRGQDFNAELHLSLRDAAHTHKQVLTVNGKNVRITIPAGVADGQVIKLKGYR